MQLTWCYALCSLSHSKIISALNLFIVDAGAVAHCIYTDFDPKILEGATAKWIVERCHKLHASPSDCQLQNGLIEHTWQMVMGMVIAHSYMMDVLGSLACHSSDELHALFHGRCCHLSI